jgi:hypothetical protein
LTHRQCGERLYILVVNIHISFMVVIVND